MREGKKFKKKRIYLGVNLNKNELSLKEKQADDKLIVLKKQKNTEFLKKIVAKIKRILKKNKVKKAGIFGSYVRGEQKRNSDIDILIKPPKGIGFGFVGIKLELEDELKKKVDLVSYDGLSPYLKKYILAEEVKIL